MPNNIEYVIRVVDDFSKNMRKFDNSMDQVNKKATRSASHLKTAGQSTRFFSAGLKDMAKAAGLYLGVREALDFSKSLFNTRMEMDSLTASLTALMPKFDKTRPAAKLAAEEIEYLKGMTEKLGVSLKEAIPSYMQFLASTKFDLGTARKTFEGFAGIARMYGLSTQRFGLVMMAINQMQGKGVISMEELRRQLGESLPGALQLFAEAAGMSTQKFIKMVETGRMGAGVLKNVAELIQKKYGKDIANAAETLSAKNARLGSSWLLLKDTMSKSLGPAMTGTITGLTSMIHNTQSLFGAVSGGIDAIYKLDESMRGLAKGLLMVKEVGGGVVDIFKFIGSTAGIIATTIGTAGEFIGAGVAGIGKPELAGEAFGEIGAGYSAKFAEYRKGAQEMSGAATNSSQKVEVQITHVNTPKGTKVEASNQTNPNVKLGNTVQYEKGGAY